MKKDIENREDITVLVDRFYDKVKKDSSIGYFFNEVAKVDWPKHLKIMYDFWENVLFFSGTYEGNPMQVHKDLHAKSAMKMPQFLRWNQLFTETVDEYFEGKNAELIKQRAVSISTVIQIKLFS